MISPRTLAHKIWQRFPPAWRREILFRLSSAFAPRPDRNPIIPPGAPVIVVGPLAAATGLGEWARLALQAFQTAGLDARGIDLSKALMQGADFPQTAWREGRDAYGPGTLVLHINAPYVPLALWLLGRRLVRGKKIIACWAWELPDIPADWRWGLPFAHEIWGLSRFTADAIARHTALPVKVTPLPVVKGEASPPEARPWVKPKGVFAALTMFNMASGFTRKNPLGAVEAFKKAFGDDPGCMLLIKTVNGQHYPEGLEELRRAIGDAANIRLMDKTFTAAETSSLIEECDAVLSLHRAEGFGLVPAEAMRRGKPVVATGWSGNMDFMNAENSCPVGYRLAPAHDPQRTYDHAAQNWAEPDTDEAAACLRRLRTDPAFAAKLGVRAAEDAEKLWNLETYAGYLTGKS
ncbi:MAG: glycosyltransferase family 4 protein [Alphaproteobacteria bacterium]